MQQIWHIDMDSKLATQGIKKAKSPIVRWLLIFSGILFTVLGIIGIFLPVLPTTPFMLLAAACFFRSSDKFYRLLTEHPRFGKYIRNYREKKGIPLKGKIMAMATMWPTILSSAYFFVDPLWLKILLIIIAAAVTIHILSFNTTRD